MTAEPCRCLYCDKQFLPSVFHPNQRVCSASQCERRRQVDYHRTKRQSDPEYRQTCRESSQKWRTQNPDYQRLYRKKHPDYVKRNRQAQQRRDRKRRVRDLVNNNLALDLKSLSADVWLVGAELENLVKNNLAISEIMIFQTVAASPTEPS